ncbi:MAG: lamin tail domain-containing protein [Planctomycetota bacterium]
MSSCSVNATLAASLVAAAGLAAPASAGVATSSPDVIITEVFYNPAGSEAETEWVEIFNAGSEPIDISGWALGDEDNNSPSDFLGAGAVWNPGGMMQPESETNEILHEIIIQPGEAIVVGGFWDPRTENPDGRDNTLEAFVQSWGFDTDDDGIGDDTDYRVILLVNTITIANTADATNEVLELLGADLNTTDFVNYQVGRGANTWPFSSNGRSVYLQPNFLNNTDNEEGLAWALAVDGRDGGTLGRMVLADPSDPESQTLYAEGDVASPGFVETSIALSFEDANDNGRDDALDIFLGTSDDCDRNRVPDDAQPDCDGNGIPDSCELFLVDVDCDRNGQPDFCEIQNNPSLDGNGNGVLDACEDVLGSIVITEIMFNPSGSESEYIELYNSGDQAIDLTGYFFQDLDQPVFDGAETPFPSIDDTDMNGEPDAFLIEPGGIVVIGDETLENWEAGWGPVEGYRYLRAPVNLANNADLVNEVRTLNTPDGRIVDVANYQGTTSNGVPQAGWPGDDGRGSFYLLGTGDAADINAERNNDGSQWALSIAGLDGARSPEVTSRFNGRDVGSPGYINFGTPERPSGEVILSEIMFATNSDFPGESGVLAEPGLDEWVEILNVSGSTIDLSGWYLADEDGQTTPLPAGATLEPNEAAIISSRDYFGLNPAPVNEYYEAWDCGYQVFVVNDWYRTERGNDNLSRLGDTGEAGTASNPSTGREILTLRKDDGAPVDVVNYDDDGFVWPLVANGLPQNPAFSIYLFRTRNLNETDNDNGLNWATSLAGFDGAINNSITAIYNAGQFGSPGFVDGITTGFDSGACLSDEFCLPDITTLDTNPGDKGFGVPDGTVDVTDLTFFVEAWVNGDAAVADVTTLGNNPGDVDFGAADGTVDVTDLTFFVEQWISGCP